MSNPSVFATVKPKYRPFSHLACELDLHVATLMRWHTKGIHGADGERHRLWAIRLGGRWVSTDEEIQRFLDRLNPGSEAESGSAVRSPATRSKAATAADRELTRLGI
ncbi:hypothetical protein V5E97_09755 [Singulisphaera sp. Ch08]|uniref:DNA-binding protein n=1 Tax=Singulisphaera sp. Ch08 TaxID=3120278 RepID=A0AAU7CMH7_9BACT